MNKFCNIIDKFVGGISMKGFFRGRSFYCILKKGEIIGILRDLCE